MTDDEIAKLCREWPNNATQAARAIIAAYQAKLLAGVEMPEPELHEGVTVTAKGKYKSTEDGFTADQLQQYATAAAAQERKRIEDAAMEWVASGGSTNLLSAIRGESK